MAAPLIPTPPSQFPGTGSNNPETLLTHTSVYCTLFRIDPGIPQIPPLFPPK